MTFVSSSQQFIDLARSTLIRTDVYPDEGIIRKTYQTIFANPQVVKVIKPALGNITVIGAGLIEEYVIANGVPILQYTVVNGLIPGGLFLATFLSYVIDWGTRPPIQWVIQAGSSLYTSVYTNPTFVDTYSLSFVPADSDLSSELRAF